MSLTSWVPALGFAGTCFFIQANGPFQMRSRRNSIIFFLCLVLLLCLPLTALCEPFETGLSQLTQRSFSKKIQGLEILVSSRDSRVEKVLSALMEGCLYYVKKNKQVVFVRQTADTYEVTPVLGGTPQENVSRRAVKKIGINNRIRKKDKILHGSDPAGRPGSVQTDQGGSGDYDKSGWGYPVCRL